jgi:hypothetical protein
VTQLTINSFGLFLIIYLRLFNSVVELIPIFVYTFTLSLSHDIQTFLLFCLLFQFHLFLSPLWPQEKSLMFSTFLKFHSTTHFTLINYLFKFEISKATFLYLLFPALNSGSASATQWLTFLDCTSFSLIVNCLVLINSSQFLPCHIRKSSSLTAVWCHETLALNCVLLLKSQIGRFVRSKVWIEGLIVKSRSSVVGL